jgi:predicted nucleic acid-binding Zn ribbon protein
MSDRDENGALPFEESKEEPEFEVITSTKTPSYDEITGFQPKYDPLPEDPDAKLPEEYRGKSKEEIIAQLTEVRKQQEELSKKADATAALSQGLAQLGQTLSKPSTTQSPPDIEAQRATYEEKKRKFAERAKERFFDEPVEVLDEYARLSIQPAFEAMLVSQIPTYRTLAELNPDVGWVMKKYGPEVDDIVNKLPPAQKVNNPSLYVEAAKRIKAEHLEEIVAEKVAVEVAKQLKTQPQPSRANVPNFSEHSSNPRPPTKTRRPAITEEDRRAMLVTGMDEDDYLRNKYNYEEK